MAQKTTPVGILLTGLALGLIGDMLFYGQFPGANVPVFSALLLLMVCGWVVYGKVVTLSARRLWLIVPVMFFALMWMLRANPELRFFNLLAVMGLLGLFAHYLVAEAHVDTTPTPEQAEAIARAGIGTSVGAVPVIARSWHWTQQHSGLDASDEIKSVLRGLGLAIPVLVVFGILFSSADLVFAEQVEGVFDFLLPDDLDWLVNHTLFTGGIAWVCTGFVAYALILRVEDKTKSPAEGAAGEPITAALARKVKVVFNLNMTEAGIVLGGVVVMFAVFVVIQFAYLFGGREMVTDDLTFAEYARRGFFELVAVSVLVLGLILALDFVTIRSSERHTAIFRVLCVLLVIETLVILTSAWRRMSLYEEAFGFTHLRIYTHVFMIWLGVLLGMAVLSLFRLRENLFSLGLLLVTMGYLGTLNLINVDALIATRNIERYNNGRELDLCYFERLSVDALDVLVDFYEVETGDAIQTHLNGWFDREERRLSGWYESYFAPAEYHVSQYGAWQTLAAMARSGSSGSSGQCLVRKDEK